MAVSKDEKKSKGEPMEVDKPGTADTSKTVEEPKKDVDVIAFENVREQIRLIERSESSKEPRLIARVLRQLVTTRRSLNERVLRRVLVTTFAHERFTPQRETLMAAVRAAAAVASSASLSSTAVTTASSAGGGSATPTHSADSLVGEQMDVDGSKPAGGRSPRVARKIVGQAVVLPEVEIYVHLLVLLFLIDRNLLDQAEQCVTGLLRRIESVDKRSVDPLAAKVYFYFSLISEKLGKAQDVTTYLNGRLRTATLHRDEESQATLVNALLRIYLSAHLYDAASKLVHKVTFPDSANNNEWARQHFYLARIDGMRLDYAAASRDLLLATRKAPQHSAVGFKQTVEKFKVVISLLMGEIPERSVFRLPIYKKALAPYLELTRTVRLGDLRHFNETLEKHAALFEKDATYSLVVRLRQNVIKTAVKQISLAYSRIGMKDIQTKLGLGTPEEAEYIVAKAIKDGSVEASVEEEPNGDRWMESREPSDVYATVEPQQQFDKRIRFCLQLHNRAVKALRYPPKQDQHAESADEQREREQLELEFAKEMAEGEDDEF